MRKTKIDSAVDALNAHKGLTYPMIGHLRYANITGDGRRYRSLYVIINDQGGVSYSTYNGRTPRKTLGNLIVALENLKHG
jgi:hypothetical protein